MTEIKKIGSLNTLEVSLVRKGANKKRFALRKSEETAMDELISAVLETDLENEAQVDKVLKAAKMSDKAQACAKSMLKLATGFKDEMPGDFMSTLAKMAGYEAPVGEKTKKSDALDLDSVPTELRPQIEALWKSAREADEKNAKLEAVLKAERDERTTKEFVTKAATEFASLPGVKSEDLGLLLKKAHEVLGEDAVKLEGVLKSAAVAIKESELLKQVGAPSSGMTGSAWAEIERGADGLVQKSEKALSKAEAIDLFLQTAEGRELNKRYLSEHPAQTGLRK